METASQNRAGDTEDWSAAYVRLQQQLKSSYQQPDTANTAHTKFYLIRCVKTA